MSYLDEVDKMQKDYDAAVKRVEDRKKKLILRYGKIAISRLEALSKIDGVDYLDLSNKEFDAIMKDREKPAVDNDEEEGEDSDI